MKKFFVLAMLFSIFLAPSCDIFDNDLEPGIKYTDNPPEVLFNGNLYATTYRCWIDMESINTAKDQEEGCTRYWDYKDETYHYYNCGMWRMISVKKYWGVIDGIIYLSKSDEWYLISPNQFTEIKSLIENRKTIIGFLCDNCNSPYGEKTLISGWE